MPSAINLHFASLAVRKAAAIRGITKGTFKPVRLGTEITNMTIVTGRNGKSVVLSSEDTKYASAYTWKEIKERI